MVLALFLTVSTDNSMQAAIFITESITAPGRSAEYDFSQIDHIYMTATTTAYTSLSEANGTSLPAGHISSGTVTLGVYRSNGTLITERSCRDNNSATWNIDLSSVTGTGYFITTTTQGPGVAYRKLSNGNYDYIGGSATCSNITVYKYSSPQISGTNLLTVFSS